MSIHASPRRWAARFNSFLILLVASSSLMAAPLARELQGDVAQKLRGSAPGEKIVLENVVLSDTATKTLELEEFQVWAKDAVINVYGANGAVHPIEPPARRYFRGQVQGDPEATVFFSLGAGHDLNGLIVTGDQQFTVGRGRKKAPLQRTIDPTDEADAPVLIAEMSPTDDATSDGPPFKCDTEGIEVPASHLRTATQNFKAYRDAGNVPFANYEFRLALETDFELRSAFASDAALTTYLGDLVGKSSTIYQRDLRTTLVVGLVNIRSTAADPWTVAPASGTLAALFELGTVWHNAYAGVARSAVVMISGKAFNGGIAWRDILCDNDVYCGDTGANCGGAAYAGKYAGAYAFCGSSGGVSTSTPNPDAVVNGTQYQLPAGNYWILLEFSHELGHVVASPHTHCVTLTPAEQATYGRAYVDNCYNGEGGCYSGAAGAPAEKGTIMSYCHLLNVGGYPASKYQFWQAGAASAKMQQIFIGSGTSGLEGSTPDGTITIGSNLPCTAGRTASVPFVAGYTYAWQIAGGTITSATNTNAITFTPNAPSVTVTVKVSTTKGCAITTSATATTQCAGIQPVQITSLAADKTLPQPEGTTLTWTATATGGTAPLQYRFWRQDNGSWYLVQGYSATNTYTWTPGAGSAGTHRVEVDVKSNGSAADYEATTFNTFTITGSPVVINSLSADKSLPQPELVAITWTANVSGGVAPLQYRFWRQDNGSWILAQNYSTTNTYAWQPPSGSAGTHRIEVDVKSAGSASDYDATFNVPFTISTRASVTSLIADKTLPQLEGSGTITWTATATGGTAPLQYRFWRRDNGSWFIAQNYSASNTYAWAPPVGSAGSHAVEVDVRSAGSAADYEGTQWNAFTISARASITGLTADLPLPQSVGATITWTATATGGQAPLLYRFWRLDNGSWYLVQGYSTSNTYTWTPTAGQDGAHGVEVDVKSTGSASDYEGTLWNPFTINP